MIFDFLKEHGLEPQRTKAVLFDMDGVLFDSMPNHVTAWKVSMARYGLSITDEQVYLNEGQTGFGTIAALIRQQFGREATDEECDLIYQAKCDVFNTCPTAPPMPGAREALEAIKAAGLKCVIVTGSGQQSLFDRLNETYPSIFTRELMVTAFDVRHGKPRPEPYLMGLRKAGVKADEAIVVENAPLGIQSGRAAGIFTVALNTGPLKDSLLYASGANVVYPNMPTFACLISQRPEPRP
ncbi:MAG: HAD-IA family hydrolase [Prevotellaceae bacterium]|nr:HAD-IA family hydrolase [Prevotellaceae bacterium]